MELNTLSVGKISNFSPSRGGLAISCYFSPGYRWGGGHRPILFIGGIHGDEPEGVELALQTLVWLNSSYASGNNSTIVVPWLLIPCINPDGYKANQRTNSNGVDLNRNFPSLDWSPNYQAPRYFPGHHPASEPETRALVRLIMQERPRLILHSHSWNPAIVVTGELALIDAQRLSTSSGYQIQNDIGYPTPGSLGQFGWNDCGIPVICIEEQEKSDLSVVWPNFAEGLRQIFGDDSPRKVKPEEIILATNRGANS